MADNVGKKKSGCHDQKSDHAAAKETTQTCTEREREVGEGEACEIKTVS